MDKTKNVIIHQKIHWDWISLHQSIIGIERQGFLVVGKGFSESVLGDGHKSGVHQSGDAFFFATSQIGCWIEGPLRSHNVAQLQVNTPQHREKGTLRTMPFVQQPAKQLQRIVIILPNQVPSILDKPREIQHINLIRINAEISSEQDFQHLPTVSSVTLLIRLTSSLCQTSIDSIGTKI